MKTTPIKLVLLAAVSAAASVFAQIPEKAIPVAREKPAEWKNLVPGGQFIDLFEPIPIMQPLTSNAWGGDNVLPRDISNGIEDPAWSYWCGDLVKGEDGRYHLYTARWPENHPRGHFAWKESEVVHAVSDHKMGPFTYQDWVGPGHNTTIYQTKKGEYLIYCTHSRFYYSNSLDGPWKEGTYIFDQRERYAFKNFVNFAFAPRDNGSMIAVSRRGYIWVSPDGRDKWYEVSSKPVYPDVPGTFEDPVMWKDEIQYHIIVNDWRGRIAYHLRSLDGFHWKTEPGEAYAPGIAVYEDGTKSDWYKYERIRMFQDEHGRPVQAHFAVIDSDKYSDKGSDKHNSKHMIIPLNVQKLIEVRNNDSITSDTKRIQVRIKAEEGFNPHTDIDIESLRFGDSVEVNYGRGGKFVNSRQDGPDLTVTFDGKTSGLTEDNWAGKLLGKTSKGKILYGWARLPGAEPTVPMLSALSPKFEYTPAGLEAYVEVTNFGEMDSPMSTVKVLAGKEGKEQVIAMGSVRALKPFEKSIVRLVCIKNLPRSSKQNTTVVLENADYPTEVFSKAVVLPGN
ncbi:MAG: glycoside hydrolase family protein [Puniceicoccaceae bacterium]